MYIHVCGVYTAMTYALKRLRNTKWTLWFNFLLGGSDLWCYTYRARLECGHCGLISCWVVRIDGVILTVLASSVDTVV